MANHDPERLQGWAAPAPSEPGWQQRAIDAVKRRQHKTRRHNERKNGLYLFFDDPLRVYLDEACFRRNISLTGYARRAMVAFIAHDLGLPIEEVAQHSAVPADYGATGGGRLTRTQDTGRTKGPWRITGVEE
ncbi:ribbon-helix-helix DNA binding domain protein [Arthrobacter phage BruhMoment]|nr:ribbon-helix-helix DNA binding domain protein [Arthrobacter phage BruhMoment]